MDRTLVCKQVSKTGRLLVVDEDCEGFGLSDELEDQTLPNLKRIVDAALKLMNDKYEHMEN